MRWNTAVAMVTHSLVWVWELVQGVRGPPAGTDKGGGRAIWVVWVASNLLSAAEMVAFSTHLHLCSEISLFFFNSLLLVKTKREEALNVQQSNFIQSNQGNLLGD